MTLKLLKLFTHTPSTLLSFLHYWGLTFRSELSQLVLNRDGSRLATASEKGTLIRIFDCVNGTRLKEVSASH